MCVRGPRLWRSPAAAAPKFGLAWGLARSLGRVRPLRLGFATAAVRKTIAVRKSLFAFFCVPSPQESLFGKFGMLGYWWKGLWVPSVTHYYLLCLPMAIPAIWAGRAVNHRLPVDRFRKYVYCGLILIGSVLAMQALV